MLVEHVAEMNKDIEELKNLMCRGVVEDIDMMNHDDFEALQLVNRTINHFKAYMIEEAAAIDCINLKLDKLLMLSKEKES